MPNRRTDCTPFLMLDDLQHAIPPSGCCMLKVSVTQRWVSSRNEERGCAMKANSKSTGELRLCTAQNRNPMTTRWGFAKRLLPPGIKQPLTTVSKLQLENKYTTKQIQHGVLRRYRVVPLIIIKYCQSKSALDTTAVQS
jgi:hypothetical protein